MQQFDRSFQEKMFEADPDRGSQRERCRNRVLPRRPRKKLCNFKRQVDRPVRKFYLHLSYYRGTHLNKNKCIPKLNLVRVGPNSHPIAPYAGALSTQPHEL